MAGECERKLQGWELLEFILKSGSPAFSNEDIFKSVRQSGELICEHLVFPVILAFPDPDWSESPTLVWISIIVIPIDSHCYILTKSS